MRVVPGQIEWNERVYYQLDAKPIGLRLRTVMPGFFDNKSTKSVMDTLGEKPLLHIAVEETLNTALLETNLVATPESSASPYGPFFNFGVPRDLSMWIEQSLDNVQCQKNHKSSETEPIWGMKQCGESWSGRYSIAELPWWTNNPSIDVQQQEKLTLQSRQWAVVAYDSGEVLQVLFVLYHCFNAS